MFETQQEGDAGIIVTRLPLIIKSKIKNYQKKKKKRERKGVADEQASQKAF